MNRVRTLRGLALVAALGVVALVAAATTAVAAPPTRSLVVTPSAPSYGLTAVGSSSEPVTFTVAYAGPGRSVAPLRLSIAGSAASDFTIVSSACGRPLRSGQTCTVRVFNDTGVPLTVTSEGSSHLQRPDNGTVLAPTSQAPTAEADFILDDDSCPVSGTAHFTSGSLVLNLQLVDACEENYSATVLPNSTLTITTDSSNPEWLTVRITR